MNISCGPIHSDRWIDARYRIYKIRCMVKPSSVVDPRVIYCWGNLERFKTRLDAYIGPIYLTLPINANRSL